MEKEQIINLINELIDEYRGMIKLNSDEIVDDLESCNPMTIANWANQEASSILQEAGAISALLELKQKIDNLDEAEVEPEEQEVDVDEYDFYDDDFDSFEDSNSSLDEGHYEFTPQEVEELDLSSVRKIHDQLRAMQGNFFKKGWEPVIFKTSYGSIIVDGIRWGRSMTLHEYVRAIQRVK